MSDAFSVIADFQEDNSSSTDKADKTQATETKKETEAAKTQAVNSKI